MRAVTALKHLTGRKKHCVTFTVTSAYQWLAHAKKLHTCDHLAATPQIICRCDLDAQTSVWLPTST